MDPSTLKQLQEIIIHSKLYGLPEARDRKANEFESDKRKVAKAVRELLAAGYLALEKPAADGEEPRYTVTTLAYDHLAAVEPSLSARCFRRVDQYADTPNTRVTVQDIDKCKGVGWDELTLGEKKWVVEHPADYRFFTWNPNWPSEKLAYHTFGDRETWKERWGYNRDLYVTNNALDEERERRMYDCEFKYIRSRNLAWGLKKAGITVEGVKFGDLIEHESDDPFHRSYVRFSLKPEEWEQNLEENIDKLSVRIANDAKRIGQYIKMQTAVNKAGGWAAFLQKYDAAIHEYLHKSEEERAKEEKEDEHEEARS